ncbi:MAG: LemA family protein [Acutalibacteraceae bacterium]
MIGWIIAGSIIGAIVIILIISVIVMYNNLVERSVRVDNAWSQIDVQMKQRYDLIPNLVETVKAYASHEKSTLEEVTKWRAAAMEAKTPEELMQSNQKLSGAIANIFATVPKITHLKANDNFLDLQRQLKELEEKIAFARQFYNDTVMKYNEYLQLFPSNIIANIFKYKERPSLK